MRPKRRPVYTRPISVTNPFQDIRYKPYLSSPVFPIEPLTESAKKALSILRGYYSKKRFGGVADIRKIESFILNPQRNVFVIWGEIGVGKTWFTRYHLFDMYLRFPKRFEYGVIDMLRASKINAPKVLERCMVPVLESYFVNTFGNLVDGLKPLAKYKAGQIFEKGTDEYYSEVNDRILKARKSHGEKYLEILLNSLEECGGPRLIIAVDNLDRALSTDQKELTDIVARMLHYQNIYIIFPLRSSSRILLDDYQILGFFEKDDMKLSALDLGYMLKPRFKRDVNGHDLTKSVLPGADQPITYPFLLDKFLSSEAGEFIIQLCNDNARKTMDFMSKILYSHRIKRIMDITNPELCIAALLMFDTSQFDPKTSQLINLFDDDEPMEEGNTLIRFRVIEFFRYVESIVSTEGRYWDYFERLGYDLNRVQEVIAIFVGVGLLTNSSGRSPDQIRSTGIGNVGTIKIVKQNVDQYFENLLSSPWYFICAKRGVHVYPHLIRKDSDGSEHITDRDFVNFLKTEEDRERGKIAEWEAIHGPDKTIQKSLLQPHILARNALRKKRTYG